MAIVLIAGFVAVGGGWSATSAGTDPGGSAAADMEPLRVYFLNSQGSTTSVSAPEGTDAANAAISYINNDLGGINGRMIEMETCFMDQTPAA